MNLKPLKPSDRDEIALSIQMRANWIETKDVCLSANDIMAMKNKEARNLLQHLDEDQQVFVRRLRMLARAIQSGEIG